MSIAAVPGYLGRDFKSASPGMRFGMFLKAWGENHELHTIDWRLCDRIWPEGKKYPKWEDSDNKVSAIESACLINRQEQLAIQALSERQSALAAALPDCFTLPAQSIAPFVTGMGNEHPLENGFSFLWPYGLPYLPGSGVKGVLRQAVRELISGEWGDNTPWRQLPSPAGKGAGGEGLSALDILFGLESEDRQAEHFRGVLTFWDVIPQIKGNQLMVEIMTPHQTHYYQGDQPPHDSGQPTPISFLTVPPGSGFTFHVQCDKTRLARIAPELAQDDQWKNLLEAAFEHAFDWLGFGAKTAVGYGGMLEDVDEKQKLQEEAEKRKKERAREAALSERISGLPDDAAAIEKARSTWNNPGDFLDFAERLLEEHEALSQAARACLVEIVESYWKGIMRNPDATQGKKKKPKFKPRPVTLAKRLTSMGS